MSYTCSAHITNKLGLHLRSAGIVAQVASRFESDIWMEYEGQRANAKSIMSILALAAVHRATVTISATGSDAERAAKAVMQSIESGSSD